MKKFLLSILCCLMAVFAVQAEEVTYEVTSTSAVSVEGTVPGGSSATYNSTYTNAKCQLTKNNSMTLTLKGYEGYKITSITLSMKSNKSAGSGNFSMIAGEETLSSITTAAFNNAKWNGAYTTTYVDVTPTMTNSDYVIAAGEDVVITIAATVNSLYCQSFTINYEAVGAVTPTAKKPEFSEESCEFNLGEPFAVTISAEDGATIHYTTDGNEPTEDSDVYSAPIVISETTTVKAIAVIDGYKNSAVAEVTYTAIDPNAPTATLSFADEAQRESLSADKQVWKQNGLTFTNDKNESSTNVADYSNPVRLYKNSSITIEAARDMSEIEFDCNTAAYATDLANSIGGVTAVGDKVTVTLSPATSYTVASLSAQVRLDAITVTYAKEPESTGFIFDFIMSEARFATLYMAVAVKIPEGVNAYIVTGTGDGYVTLQPVTGIIPANTGVILEAEQGEYELVSYAEGTADVTGNLLEGSLFDSIIEGEAYVLGNVDGNVGFYKAELDELEGTAFQNQANKAYLPASSVENKAIQYFSFDFGGGTTGIEGVEAEGAVSDRIYDITGREVKSIASPGIYIVNGKKVLVK